MHFNKIKSIVSCLSLITLCASLNVHAEGNRYSLPRAYHSEISSANAYILTNYNQGNVSKSEFANTVLIDVRTVEEYGAGHPANSYNIPFPHIHARPNKSDYIGQNSEQFVNDVIAAFPDRSTPILTLCRTGYRSVLAGNLLAAAGYTNVRNIWEGFVGNTKVDTTGATLDVNNDGEITDKDRDGWSNYQDLPYSTKLLPQLIYAPYEYLYYE